MDSNRGFPPPCPRLEAPVFPGQPRPCHAVGSKSSTARIWARPRQLLKGAQDTARCTETPPTEEGSIIAAVHR